MKSFLIDYETTLSISSNCTASFPVTTGIPQGSPVFPIFYLFYNANLLEACSKSGRKATAMRFVDDVNILAYSTSTEETAEFLKGHTNCTQSGRTYMGLISSWLNTSSYI